MHKRRYNARPGLLLIDQLWSVSAVAILANLLRKYGTVLYERQRARGCVLEIVREESSRDVGSSWDCLLFL